MAARDSTAGRLVFLKRADILIIALILASAAGLYFYGRQPSAADTVARIYVNGEEYTSIPLGDPANDGLIINPPCVPALTVIVEHGAVRFTDSQCPDHLCEHFGELKSPGDTAVCVPARTVLKITSGSVSSPDGVAF